MPESELTSLGVDSLKALTVIFELEEAFMNNPRDLMNSVQADSVSPFPEMVGLKERID